MYVFASMSLRPSIHDMCISMELWHPSRLSALNMKLGDRPHGLAFLSNIQCGVRARLL